MRQKKLKTWNIGNILKFFWYQDYPEDPYSHHIQAHKLFRTLKHMKFKIPIALEWSLASIYLKQPTSFTKQPLQYPTSYYIVKFLLHGRISTSANFGWISSLVFFPETSSAYTTKQTWRNSTYPTPIPWPKGFSVFLVHLSSTCISVCCFWN